MLSEISNLLQLGLFLSISNEQYSLMEMKPSVQSTDRLELQFQLKVPIYVVDDAGEAHSDSIKLTPHLSRNMSPAWVPKAFFFTERREDGDTVG